LPPKDYKFLFDEDCLQRIISSNYRIASKGL
jgi:hypothetical protein